MFSFSYASDNEMVKAISENWHFESVSVDRHVGGFSKNGRKVNEILISNRKISI